MSFTVTYVSRYKVYLISVRIQKLEICKKGKFKKITIDYSSIMNLIKTLYNYPKVHNTP